MQPYTESIRMMFDRARLYDVLRYRCQVDTSPLLYYMNRKRRILYKTQGLHSLSGRVSYRKIS